MDHRLLGLPALSVGTLTAGARTVSSVAALAGRTAATGGADRYGSIIRRKPAFLVPSVTVEVLQGGDGLTTITLAQSRRC